MPPPRKRSLHQQMQSHPPTRTEVQRMEDAVHQPSPYEDMVLDPDGYWVPAPTMNVEHFTQNMLADNRRKATLPGGKTFRQRMLDPSQRRSTNVEDRRGWQVVSDRNSPPNLNEPVPPEVGDDPFIPNNPRWASVDLEEALRAVGRRKPLRY